MIEKENPIMEDKYEVRYYLYGGLACPNPREHYLRTRSYQDMRAEYDLLNCNKFTDEDMMKLAMIQSNYSVSMLPLYLSYGLLFAVEISVLIWFIWRMFW